MYIAKKVGIFCIQLFILIAIYQLGSLAAQCFHSEIPGNVLGMIFLFLLLWLRVIKIGQIQLAANLLLKHLGFFFIPISVGLMTLGPVIIHHGISILFVLSFSAAAGLIAAGRATQTMINKREEGEVKYHDHTV